MLIVRCLCYLLAIPCYLCWFFRLLSISHQLGRLFAAVVGTLAAVNLLLLFMLVSQLITGVPKAPWGDFALTLISLLMAWVSIAGYWRFEHICKKENDR